MRVRSTIEILTALPLVIGMASACAGPGSSATAAQPQATLAPVLATAAATAAATLGPAETVAPTATPTEAPTPSPAPISITNVECLTGQTVRFHVHISSGVGIAKYQLWSTWGGGGDSEHPFSGTLPLEVDEDVEFTHAFVDPEPRVHQFGLAVTLEGVADPIIVYEIEPDGRCPGH